MKKTLLTALAALAVTLTAAAQQPAKPPMKMGLWESKGVVSPGSDIKGTPAGHELTIHNCVTPENWLKLMGPDGPGTCPKVNEVWTQDTYSFDIQCSGKPKMGSVSVHFIDPETQHVIVGISATPTGEPMNVQQEFDDHWLRDACGDVSPSQPVIVR
jgi:hypothetical protein